MKRAGLTCMLLLLAAWYIHAQPGFIGTREGLSNRYVSAIVQGKDGLIWIGTRNGLNHFDGYTFTQYSTYTTPVSLSGSSVNALLGREDGSMLIGTSSGLNILSPNHTLVRVLNKKEILSVCHQGGLSTLVSTSDGEIISIDNDLHTQVISKQGSVAYHLGTDWKHNVWFTTYGPQKLWKLGQPAPFTDDIISSNFILRGDTLMAYFQDKGLCLFNTATADRIAMPFLDSVNTLYKKADLLYEDSKHNTWIAYGGGRLVKINLRARTLENYSRFFNREYFGSKINCIYEDNAGMMWIGTDGGFVKIPRTSGYFRTCLVNNNPADEEQFISVRGILSDRAGNVFYGTYKGLFCEDRATGAMQCCLLKDKQFNSVMPVPYQMTWDDEAHILLTSYTQGLLRFNPQHRTFESALSVDDKNEKQLLGLLKDSKGITWVGSYKSLYLYDPVSRMLSRYRTASDSFPVKGAVWSIAEGPGHIIWAGTAKGLYRIDPVKRAVKHYHSYSVPPVPSNELQCVNVESDSVLWLASRGGGLIRFNPVTEKYRCYTTSNGLADNIVYSIIPDRNYLWLSTENGLSRFNKETGIFRNYYEKDGISSNEFNAAAMHRAQNGEIYFGGINGITSFFPQHLSDSMEDPQIILTSMSKSQEEVPFEHRIGQPDLSVTLPYNDNFLSLRFILTDFYQPQFNNFLYKIEGIDQDWINLGAQNFLRINHLPAGAYKLLIKGRNMNGTESSNRITVHLLVGQAFYKQAWFIALIISIITIIVYAGFRFRIQQLLALQKLRTKIASDLHDEVGSMLTRISILTELLKYKNQNNNEIEQIAAASRLATNTMSDVLWSVDARNDKMGNLVDRMRDHADSLLLPLGKQLHFTTNMNMSSSMNMQERQNLLLIFKEAIHNIAKHSNATEVNIRIVNEPKGFCMQIRDNGTVFNQRSSGSGQGLKNMQMRAEEIGAKLEITMQEGCTLTLTRKTF